VSSLPVTGDLQALPCAHGTQSNATLPVAKPSASSVAPAAMSQFLTDSVHRAL